MSIDIVLRKLRHDPVLFVRFLWPHVELFREQREMMYSVRDNDETMVVAANMLGKDFTASKVALWGFLTHRVARVVTTSVKDDHLRVLWGEIGRDLQSSRIPLTIDKGGPLLVNHRDIRKVDPITNETDTISYLRGMVSEKGEGLAGHHAPYTLGIVDEASGVDNIVYTQIGTWAKKLLAFGNANNCALDHWFRKAVREGDVAMDRIMSPSSR